MMHEWFKYSEKTRYAYAKKDELLEAVLNPRNLGPLMATLEVPGKPATLKRLSADEKLEAISHQIEHLKAAPTSFWHGLDELDILAGAFWRAQITKAARHRMWPSVRKEADLLLPMSRALEADGYQPFKEISTGRRRVDILGFKRSGFIFKTDKLVAVELKNDFQELKKGFNQMTTYTSYANLVYLGCTPALCVQFLDEHTKGRRVKKWDPNALDEKLRRAGLGLSLIEGEETEDVIDAKWFEIDDEKKVEVLEQLRPATVVDTL